MQSYIEMMLSTLHEKFFSQNTAMLGTDLFTYSMSVRGMLLILHAFSWL